MNFGVLIYPGAEELDFAGPWEMLTMWREVATGPENCLVIAQDKAPVVCAKGLSCNPDESFRSCPQLDYLLVPGGRGSREQASNTQLLEFVARQAQTCRAILSVCTGSFILQAAGLLSGRKATTHWGSLDRLRDLGVQVVEQRFVRDGHVWSAAGVSAGIDMMLAFIADAAGEEAAGKVQFAAEYYPDGRDYGEFRSHVDAPAYLSRPPV